jgi:hypothetical protein
MIESDHQLHVASSEPHPQKKNLWQRWMEWSGSFLVLSILFHALIIAIATFLIVQVVHGRKEGLKFTAPPPAPPAAEHKVKPAKKSVSAPAVTKRITTTAVNVSVSLPPVDLSSPSTSTDLMGSVMGSVGASGLGGGVGGASGVGGVAALPLSGLTAFGFKSGNAPGLRGRLYDFKQTTGRQVVRPDIAKIYDDFFAQGWNESVFQKYYRAKDEVVGTQFFIPVMRAVDGPTAFGVEKEVQPSFFGVLYKGRVTAPKSGTFRFIGQGDDIVAVRFDGKNVFYHAAQGSGAGLLAIRSKYFQDTSDEGANASTIGFPGVGQWFTVDQGKTYDMEVLLSEVPGGLCLFYLLIEEKGAYYAKRKDNARLKAYPVFQTRSGVPFVEGKLRKNPDTAPSGTLIFNAVK